MATEKTSITKINLLDGEFCLNKVTTNIRQWDGFSKKVGVHIGDSLTNIYRSHLVPSSLYKIQKHKGRWVVYGNGSVSYGDYMWEMSPYYFKTRKLGKNIITVGPVSVDFSTAGVVSIKYKTSTIPSAISSLLSADYAEDDNNYYVALYSTGSLRQVIRIAKDGNSWENIADKVVIMGRLQTPSAMGPTAAGPRYIDAFNAVDDSVDRTHRVWYRSSFTSGVLVTSTTQVIMGPNGTYNGGRKIPVGDSGFAILYYGDTPTGISYNGNKVVDIDSAIAYDRSGKKLYYLDNEGQLCELFVDRNSDLHPECSRIIQDRYILFNTTSYANTIDLETGKAFSRSDDWNDRIMTSGSAGDYRLFASGCDETVMANDTSVSFSDIYPARVIAGNPTHYWVYLDNIWGNPKKPVNIYVGGTTLETPEYRITYWGLASGGSVTGQDNFMVDRLWPDYDNDVLSNVPVVMTVTDSAMNRVVFTDGTSGESFMSAVNPSQMPVMGYMLTSYGHMENIFMIQGVFYCIQGRYIMRINYDNDGSMQSLETVANKGDLVFVGNTLRLALFYSYIDRTLYAFSGGMVLDKYIECTRISKINSFYADPSRSIILISTDIGVVCVYETQLFQLTDSDEGDNYIYYTDNGYVVGEYQYHFLRDEYDQYERIPVQIESEFWGDGDGKKSYVDAVYIRVFADEIKEGKVSVASVTLNDKALASDKKDFIVREGDIDKITGTVLIRYQPRYQASVGFKLMLNSDFPISDISVGHTSEGKVGAKNNI